MTVFDFIDVDQSKTIDFDELNSYYCKVNGLSEILETETTGLNKNKSWLYTLLLYLSTNLTNHDSS